MPEQAMGLNRKDALVGAIEGGGTKFVCAVGSGPGDQLLARVEFPTGDDPKALMATVVDWLKVQEKSFGRLAALGVASFGPIDLHRSSPTYGFITSTPKPGWKDADVLGPLRQAFVRLPIGFDTDTNGAALGEHFWGAGQGLEDFVYITIGTGVGIGVMTGGRLLHGLVHPEGGHLHLPRAAGDDFEGTCPYHGRCWEGLVSGPAIKKRTGISAKSLPADHPAWDFVTQYVGCAVANLVFTLSPRRVILGGSIRKGGLLGEAAFFDSARKRLQAALNRYIVAPSLLGDGIHDYLVPPRLGDDAGVCGAIALGQCAAE
jgi:fructokinase